MRYRDVPTPIRETERKPEENPENLMPVYEGTTEEKMEQADAQLENLLRGLDGTNHTTDTGDKLDPEKLFADFGYKESDFRLSAGKDALTEKETAVDRFLRETDAPDPSDASADTSDFWLGLQEAIAEDASGMRDTAHTDFKESYDRFSDSKLYNHKLTLRGIVRKSGANCQAYAYNMPLNMDGGKYADNPYPGYYAGANRIDTLSKLNDDMRYGSVESLKKIFKGLMDQDMAALGREMREVSGDYQPKEGERMIAVAVAPWIPVGFTEISDYHFYVRDNDGYWSHKRGVTDPTRLDDHGNLIKDPATCERGYYTKFLGYYVMQEED